MTWTNNAKYRESPRWHGFKTMLFGSEIQQNRDQKPLCFPIAFRISILSVFGHFLDPFGLPLDSLWVSHEPGFALSGAPGWPHGAPGGSHCRPNGLKVTKSGPKVGFWAQKVLQGEPKSSKSDQKL